MLSCEDPAITDDPVTAGPDGRKAPLFRLGWAILSWFLVESLVFGLAVLPAAILWVWLFRWPVPGMWLRILLLAMSLFPAYLIFAIALMVLSAGTARLFGWRTPSDREMRVADFEWPLLDWARYLMINHIVRVFVGTLLRATPLWTLYLRLNGARIGRRVYVNSLGVMDHNLLEIGEGAAIGSDVHLAGHTYERGFVKTAPVRIGAEVMIGVGSWIGIGVEIGDGAQVGALSVVPKYRVIEAGAVYTGAFQPASSGT